MPFFTSTFETVRDQKQAQRKAALKKAESVLTTLPVSPHADEIVNATAAVIAAKIRATEWTSIEVVATFARRCIKAHNDINCLTEVMIAEALETAKAQDNHQTRTGSTLGPLHGIPYTLKDSYDVAGYDTSLGFSSMSNNPLHGSCVLHSTLSRLGGICLAKTNVPQTLLSFECNNPLWGKTENPVVVGFSCGGSTGGEAAVLGRGGSVVGFGSDIGGSLRIPAGWSGIFSLKTVNGRFTQRGHGSLSPGFEAIPVVTGPLGRNIEDLKFIMKLVLDEDLTVVDATVKPSPWNEAKFTHYVCKEKLKFGYYFDDGVTISSPPVKRAIEQTVNALQAKGHEVELITPPNVVEAVRIFIALTSNESSPPRPQSFPSSRMSPFPHRPPPLVHCYLFGADRRYANLRLPMKSDPMEATVSFLLTLGSWPRWFRTLVTYVIHYLLRDPVTASTMALIGNKSAAECNEWVSRRQAYRQQFNDFVKQGRFDAVIAPVSTIPATKLGGTKLVGALATSTLLYNVLDYPVGVVPVTTVEKGEVMADERWRGREKEGYAWMFLDQVYGRSGVYKEIMEDGIGLPVGVQVVGSLAAGEEGVLALMGRVYDAIKS